MKVVILTLILLCSVGFLTPAIAATTQTTVSWGKATTHRPSFKQKKKHNWAGTSKVKKCKKSKRRR